MRSTTPLCTLLCRIMAAVLKYIHINVHNAYLQLGYLSTLLPTTSNLGTFCWCFDSMQQFVIWVKLVKSVNNPTLLFSAMYY